MAIFNLPIARVGDDNFRVGSGYKLYFYEAGTLTAKDTFTDNTYATPLANPVVADGNGRFSVIWTSGNYKVILKTDEDVTVWTVDNYSNDTDSTKFAEGVLSAAGSAANVITASLPTTPGTLTDQLQVVVELQHGANTASAVTFNLNSLGAKTVKRDNNQALAIGDTGGSGNKLYLSYSATNDVWILLNPVVPIGQSLEWKRGLAVTNGTDTEHDMDVATGSILDSTEARILSLTTAITKRIDATFATGTGNGGLSNQDSSGVVQADTFYGVFLIGTAAGATDVIFATTQANALADTVAAAAGYTYARMIDVVFTDDPDANIINTINGSSGWKYFKSTHINVSTAASGTANLRDTPVPPNMIGKFVYYLFVSDSTSPGTLNGVGILTSPYQDNIEPTTNVYTVKSTTTATGTSATTLGVGNTVVVEVKVDASSQVRQREATIFGDSLGVRIDCTAWQMDYTITDLV